MARARSTKNILPKLVETTGSIVYLVQRDGTILFCNQALADWMGLLIESIVGSRLIYATEQPPHGTDNRLMGICPPPELLEPPQESPRKTEFLITAQQGTSQVWRNARAVAILDSKEDDFLILVVGDSTDLPAPPEIEPSGERTPGQLHSQLALIRQHANLAYRLDQLVGTSSFATRLRRQATFAAECNVDLLIVGPPGSGKEHAARAIHSARSARENDGILTPIDCAIADQQLIHAAISQTIAHRKSQRRLETVDRGVPRETDALLLLNVDQLSGPAQTELLGFLQLPDFGLRIIATSHVQLCELPVDQFLEELAAHLSAMTIQIPPLHCRTEDIPLLAQAILERANLGRPQQVAGIDAVTNQLLMEFQWPGNLDQLSEVITAASRKTDRRLIAAEDLPKKFHDSIKAQRIGEFTETEIELEQYLQQIEKELLARAIQQAKGNKTKAAKLLGISRAKFLRRLQFFDLELELEFAPVEPAKDVLEPSAFEEID